MPRIAPLSREELSEFEPFFEIVEGAMGFVPTSLFTMGRSPALLRAFAGLTGTVLAGSRLEPALVHLVSYVASRAAGCAYCQAHTSHSAGRAGVAPEKLDASFELETSTLFDDRERAALRLARDAALVPNAARDAHFDALREHFSEEEIVEITLINAIENFYNLVNLPLGIESDGLCALVPAAQQRGTAAETA